MKTIYKYSVPIKDSFLLELPENFQPLKVEMQGAEPKMWALVDTSDNLVTIRFRWFGTGHMIPSYYMGHYVGSVLMHGGSLVFHLFAEWSEAV